MWEPPNDDGEVCVRCMCTDGIATCSEFCPLTEANCTAQVPFILSKCSQIRKVFDESQIQLLTVLLFLPSPHPLEKFTDEKQERKDYFQSKTFVFEIEKTFKTAWKHSLFTNKTWCSNIGVHRTLCLATHVHHSWPYLHIKRKINFESLDAESSVQRLWCNG